MLNAVSVAGLNHLSLCYQDAVLSAVSNGSHPRNFVVFCEKSFCPNLKTNKIKYILLFRSQYLAGSFACVSPHEKGIMYTEQNCMAGSAKKEEEKKKHYRGTILN